MNNKDQQKNKKQSEQPEPEYISGTLPGDKSIRKRRERPASLKRTLGVMGIFSIAYGNLGSSIYYALGVTALFAMGATPFVFMLAALFFIFTAASYAEGTAAIPEAGGSSSFARKAFNEFVSFIAGWCLLLGYVVIIAIASFTAINYLGHLPHFSYLATKPWKIVGTGALLLILMLINIIGTRESAVFSTVFTIIDIATQSFLVIIGLFLFLNMPKMIDRIHLGVVPTWNQLIISFYIVMISFTGIETISNLAEESREPGSTVPRSIWWSMGVVLVMFFLISSVALSAMPVEYRAEGYIYTMSKVADENVDVEELNPTQKLIYYKDVKDSPPGFPVNNVTVKVTQLIPLSDNNSSPGTWRTWTDENGKFEIRGIAFGKHSFKLFKKGYVAKEFTFDTSKPKTVPIKGQWTTDLTRKWENDPVSGIASAISKKLPIMKEPLETWVAIVAFTIMVIAANAGIMAVSRLIYSMGSNNQVPPILAKVTKKSRSPYVAIIIFSAVAFIITLPGDLEKLTQVYAFSALISYTIAHVSIIAMRIKFPDMERPYKIPFNIRIKGKEIPISAIIGGLVCFSIWLIAAFYRDYGRNVGILFILSGILIYWLYRRHKGLSLTETKKKRK
ncbi:MAG: amino acid permease [Candidatus Eremiobacteraeota bacterium]|nr:amino acid permease [Candidatus Eremiobacteraeota bacterium]